MVMYLIVVSLKRFCWVKYEQVLECHRYNVGASAFPLLWKTGYTTN